MTILGNVRLQCERVGGGAESETHWKNKIKSQTHNDLNAHDVRSLPLLLLLALSMARALHTDHKNWLCDYMYVCLALYTNAVNITNRALCPSRSLSTQFRRRIVLIFLSHSFLFRTISESLNAFTNYYGRVWIKFILLRWVLHNDDSARELFLWAAAAPNRKNRIMCVLFVWLSTWKTHTHSLTRSLTQVL